MFEKLRNLFISKKLEQENQELKNRNKKMESELLSLKKGINELEKKLMAQQNLDWFKLQEGQRLGKINSELFKENEFLKSNLQIEKNINNQKDIELKKYNQKIEKKILLLIKIKDELEEKNLILFQENETLKLDLKRFEASKEIVRLNKLNLSLENYSECKIRKLKIQVEDLEKEIKRFESYSEGLEKELDKLEKLDGFKITKIELENIELRKNLKDSKENISYLRQKNEELYEELSKKNQLSLERYKNNMLLTKKNKEFKELNISLIKYAEIKLGKIEAENFKLKEELQELEKNHKEQIINKELEIKKIEEKFKEEKKSEKEIIFSGKWMNKKKFLESKRDLVELLRTFDEIDFKEMYLEGKKKGILNYTQEKNMSNILTRLKLDLLLTKSILEKIIPFYIELMEEIDFVDTEELENKNLENKNLENEEFKPKEWMNYLEYKSKKDNLKTFVYSFKKNYFKELYIETKKINFLNSVEERHLINLISLLDIGRDISTLNLERTVKIYDNFMKILYKTELENLSKDLIREFDIENYTAEDCFYIYEELKKTRNIPKWFRLFILSLGRQKEEKLEITDYQYKIAKSYYIELEKIIKKINDQSVIQFHVQNFPQKIEEEKIITEDKVFMENNLKTFNNLLFKGLEAGVVEMKELQEVNFDIDDDAYDIYEAIEILEERGIRINY